jgi:DNA-binding NtrC family response regulator
MKCHGKYLLLVDEHNDMRDLLCQELAQQGYVVVAVGDDEHALHAVQQASYFAVIFDGGSREDAGLSLIQRLLVADARLPCVAESGSADAVVSEALQCLDAIKRLAIPQLTDAKKRILEQGSSKVVA